MHLLVLSQIILISQQTSLYRFIIIKYKKRKINKNTNDTTNKATYLYIQESIDSTSVWLILSLIISLKVLTLSKYIGIIKHEMTSKMNNEFN